MKNHHSPFALFLRLMFYVFVAWCLGFFLFFIRLPEPLSEAPAKTEAIVVLTGGTGRLEAGISLLKAGVGKRLLVSGVHPDVVKTELVHLTGAAPELFDCCIDLDYAADNTFENATETARWMDKNQYSKLILVTADFHMQRSHILFRRAMPDAEIVRYSVATPVGVGMHAREYTKYLVTLLQEAFNR